MCYQTLDRAVWFGFHMSRLSHIEAALVRVALIADTHGVLDPRLRALIDDCDACVHAGDIGGGAVLAAITPRGGHVVAVRGNNDVAAKWPEVDRHSLARLPDEAALDLPGGRLVVVHGDQYPARDRHKRLRRAYPDAQALVYGHSHRLVCDRDIRPWVLNPGAAGRTRTYGGPSCLILTAARAGWEIESVRLDPPAQK